jgi:hypothetical protein
MQGRTGTLRWRAAAGAAAVALTLGVTCARAADLAPFDATFTVEWRGMKAGTAKLGLTRKDTNRWVYTSENIARGVFRLAVPGTIRQSTELRIEDGRIVPQHFVTDDGTTKTSRDADVHFDWPSGRATGTAEGKAVDAPLQPGLQDSLSVQIAMINELLQGRTPTGFVLLDGNEVKNYEYTAEGQEQLDTTLGPQETRKYRSRRPDSDRSTIFWCAPGLGFLPVKVERHKGDKVEWSMSLQKLDRG